METPKKKPKVSVCVVTYNQEKYIRQCLQSIIDQKTSFDFEIIVADDCSPDGTQNIIEEFARRYPTIVKPIFHKNNIGPYMNFDFVHRQAIGEYIAHVDGDDYCLPGKLQAQTDVLDSDPECNIVWHRVFVEKSNGEINEGPLRDDANIDKLKFDRGAIIQYISIGTNSSKMYRKSVRDFTLPKFELVDYFANVEQVGNGVARFAGCNALGVYRLGIGIASSSPRTRQILAKCFVTFSNKYPIHRLQINTAALMYFIADLKNRRNTWPMFFGVWLKTFHWLSIFNLLKNLHFIKQLRLDN